MMEQIYERDNVFVEEWEKLYSQILKFSVNVFECQSFTNFAFIDAENTYNKMNSLRKKILESELNDFTKEKIDEKTNVVGFYLNKCHKEGYNPHKEKNNYSKLSFMLEFYPKLNSLN